MRVAFVSWGLRGKWGGDWDVKYVSYGLAQTLPAHRTAAVR